MVEWQGGGGVGQLLGSLPAHWQPNLCCLGVCVYCSKDNGMAVYS